MITVYRHELFGEVESAQLTERQFAVRELSPGSLTMGTIRAETRSRR